MPMTKAEAGRKGGLASQAKLTPAERHTATRRARRELAVREIVRQWPELTDEQQQRLRALLRPVPEAGGRDEAA